MGMKATEALAVTLEDLPMYLRANHSVYMDVDGVSYYLTDVNDRFWRAQDTTQLNDKGHYVDCSELMPTIGEFMDLAFVDGKTIPEVFDSATSYASVKE